MGTSKSSDEAGGISVDEAGEYVGGVSVFSGRRDPVWTVGADDARELLGLWESLEIFDGAAPAAPPLGYRGSLLRTSGREWSAYRGAVVLREGAAAETRRDPGRRFERMIISTAPEGSVPPQLLDAELRADA